LKIYFVKSKAKVIIGVEKVKRILIKEKLLKREILKEKCKRILN